jgi:Uma2 family endonuclease
MKTMSTTPTTADPLVPPQPSSAPPASPSVPTLDDLERLPPGECRVFRGVDWEFYQQVLEVAWGRRWLRVAFDGRDLEIMATGAFHEAAGDFAWRLIEIVSEELEIVSASLGKTTWMRPEINRGIEADQCFFFLPEKLEAVAVAIARTSENVGDYPNPDLAIEVDISRPKVDRPGIYAALKVPEIWRFTASGLTIERLTDQGTYAAVDTSGFLPIRSVEVVRWVLQEDRSNLLAWKRRLRDWVRAELTPRRGH